MRHMTRAQRDGLRRQTFHSKGCLQNSPGYTESVKYLGMLVVPTVITFNVNPATSQMSARGVKTKPDNLGIETLFKFE